LRRDQANPSNKTPYKISRICTQIATNKNHLKIAEKKHLGLIKRYQINLCIFEKIDKKNTKLIFGLLQEVQLQTTPNIIHNLDGKNLKLRE